MKTQLEIKGNKYQRVMIQDQNHNLYTIVINPDTKEIYSDTVLEEVNEIHKGTFDLDEIGDNGYLRALLVQNSIKPTLNAIQG